MMKDSQARIHLLTTPVRDHLLGHFSASEAPIFGGVVVVDIGPRRYLLKVGMYMYFVIR